jgi:hypothetical protein
MPAIHAVIPAAALPGNHPHANGKLSLSNADAKQFSRRVKHKRQKLDIFSRVAF